MSTIAQRPLGAPSQRPRVRGMAPFVCALGLLSACNRDASKADEKPDANTPVEANADADTGAARDEPVDANKLDLGAPAAGDTGGGPIPTAADTGGADTGGADTGGAAAPPEVKVDPAVLLKETSNKKTTDERALAALSEAEAAGAKPADLAKAANSRGEALHKEPERAAAFFKVAMEKDPKAAAPVFNLAKQAAIQGDVDEVKRLLTEVHARKGKKLLAQIEYDPMWEIVKDDPDVRALLK